MVGARLAAARCTEPSRAGPPCFSGSAGCLAVAVAGAALVCGSTCVLVGDMALAQQQDRGGFGTKLADLLIRRPSAAGPEKGTPVQG